MRKRGLPDPAAPPPQARSEARQSAPGSPGDAARDETGYTGKTPLCACGEPALAWQIREVLRRAGIDAWLQVPQAGASWDVSCPRVLVAADQLDEARAIASRLIPPEIVELVYNQTIEYEPPVCPACGAADPTLDGPEAAGDADSEPGDEAAPGANRWFCESCGHAWIDRVEPEPETGEARWNPCAKTERAARQQGSSFPGRIVPTEAKPSELSGCIVGAGRWHVKEKSGKK